MARSDPAGGLVGFMAGIIRARAARYGWCPGRRRDGGGQGGADAVRNGVRAWIDVPIRHMLGHPR